MYMYPIMLRTACVATYGVYLQAHIYTSELFMSLSYDFCLLQTNDHLRKNLADAIARYVYSVATYILLC